MFYSERCIQQRQMHHQAKWDTCIRVRDDIPPKSKQILLHFERQISSLNQKSVHLTRLID